jgi:toxin ParE1/3/4
VSHYTLSARARLDIQLIWNYIAEHNFDAADRVRNELREAMKLLSDMPGLGHHRSDVKNPRLRFWSVRSYVIAYNPDAKPIHIVRVVHGAQNFKKLFK